MPPCNQRGLGEASPGALGIEKGDDELKHRLPVWTPHCAEFKDNHRAIADAVKPLNRLMLDFDEKGHTDEIMSTLKIKHETLKSCGIEVLLIEESVRRGTHVLVELPDGNILCSIRLREARGFNLLTENGDVIRDPWRAKSLYSGNSCNADILLTPQGLIHTYLRHPSLRRDLSLAVSDDNGSTWRKIMSLQPEDAAYSTMTLLPNGDLGILYEDGSFSSGNGYAITFLTITKKQLAKMVRQSKKK